MTPSDPTAETREDEPRLRRIGLGITLALGVLLFLLRWTGPSNLTDNDQERPASYVLDAVVNGHWLVQQDWTGDLTSKPPFYTWLAALCSVVAGRVSLLTLYLPCAFAMVGTAVVANHIATRVMGWRCGFLAGLFVLANPLTAKLVALARTDAVFTVTVSCTAVLVFRAWSDRRGWIAAWVMAGVATLAKGPFGLLLGFAGLAALWTGVRSLPRGRSLRPHVLGLALFLCVAGGWFALAWGTAGDALVQKMLKAELVQHAVREEGGIPGKGLLIAPAYFFSRFAPWSLLTLVAAVPLFRTPRNSTAADALRRFCVGWWLTGLLMLGLASHQRGDLVAPLVLPGAVLAAGLVTRWTDRWSGARFVTLFGLAAFLFALGMQFQHAGRPRAAFADTRGCVHLARAYLDQGGDPHRLLHVDAPFAVQFHLQTMNRSVTPEQAAERMKADPTLAAAVADVGALARALELPASRIRALARWPETGEPKFQIVSIAGSP